MIIDMQLEQQVTSLDLCRRLKELNVKQESLFYYQNNPYNDGQNDIVIMINEVRKENNSNNIINTECENNFNAEKYSAFTISELLELMPLINGSPLQLIKGYKILETIPTYCARYDNLMMHYSTLEELPDKNPANALAKMLIHLYENGYMKNE